MRELAKWSEDGATPEELRVLAAARALRPSAASRARVTAALAAGSATLLVSSASAASKAGGGLLLKIVGPMLAVGLVVGVAWHSLHSVAAPPAVRSAPTAVAVVTVAPTALPAASLTDPSPALASERASADSPPVLPARAAPAASAGLSEEVAALEGARRALAAGRSDRALRELHAYDTRFPRGALASEAAVLRVQALLASGQGARAVALADKFSAAHPESPFARRVQELVRSARSGVKE